MITPSRIDLGFIVAGVSTLTTIDVKNCVEIGSRDGEDTNLISGMFRIPHENCIVFEPNPDSCKAIIEKYPRFQTFNNAISSTTSTQDFYIDNNNIGCCSLLKVPGQEHQSIKIECLSMESVIDSLNLPSVDVCKVDVEGSTFDVLQSFGKHLNLLKAVQFESELTEVWSGQAVYSDIKRFLESHDFVEALYGRITKVQVEALWVQRHYYKHW